jgi:hypothetical protein
MGLRISCSTAIGGDFAGWHGIAASSAAAGVPRIGDDLGHHASDLLFHNNANGGIGFGSIAGEGKHVGWHDVAGTGYNIVR